MHSHNPSRRSAATLIIAGALILALAGCTNSSTHASATAKPTSTSTSPADALDSLQPIVPKTLTSSSAKTATDNLAKSIDGLIENSDIVYVDSHEQLIKATATTGATYAVLHTINVSVSLDPLQQAQAMEKLLVAAGWKLEDHTTATGKYLAAMSSSSNPTKAWFLLLGGDSTVKKSPVVTVQLASPNIPKS